MAAACTAAACQPPPPQRGAMAPLRGPPGLAGTSAVCAKRRSAAVSVRPAVCCQATDSHDKGFCHSRRTMFGLLGMSLPAMGQSALAAEEDSTTLSPTASRGELYKTKYYQYYVPRGWEPIDLGSKDSTVPSIESKFMAADGKQSVNVSFVEASGIKPTFMQIQDVSDWGGPQEVFRLISSGSRLLTISSTVIPGVERDTGTIRGVVRAPDTTIYFYELLDANDAHQVMAVAARGGKVWKAICSAPDDLWKADAAIGPALKKIVGSFRLS